MVVGEHFMKRVEAWACINVKDGTMGPILFKYCIRCGKLLKNPDAQLRGYGEVCWKKTQLDKQTKLF